MSVIRVGSTSMYADGWESIFGRGPAGGRQTKKSAAKTGKKKATAKRVAKKPAKKSGKRR